MAEQSEKDARTDLITADKVSEGIEVCTQHGVHPALVHMEDAGVPRHVALRVLCSPRHFRTRDRRRASRIMRSTIVAGTEPGV